MMSSSPLFSAFDWPNSRENAVRVSRRRETPTCMDEGHTSPLLFAHSQLPSSRPKQIARICRANCPIPSILFLPPIFLFLKVNTCCTYSDPALQSNSKIANGQSGCGGQRAIQSGEGVSGGSQVICPSAMVDHVAGRVRNIGNITMQNDEKDSYRSAARNEQKGCREEIVGSQSSGLIVLVLRT